MNEFIRFALLGLGVGAIYGLVAQGLVLIFLGNKVLNFSQGAIALVAAYSYHELIQAGLPLGGAAAGALVVSAAMGALIEIAIMRPLQHATSVTKLVATIGILTVVQSAAALRYGDTTQFVEGLLPQTTLRFGTNLAISADRALLFLIGVVLTGALVWLHNKTRFGLATAAAAENVRAAEVLGWSARRISLANWVLGATLAGLAGILIAPINGLNAAAMGTVIYGALAAALIGGFRSFTLAMGGGVLLGVAQAESVRLGGDVGWSTAIPFVVILVAVLLRRNVVTMRGEPARKLATVGDGRASRWTIAFWVGCLVLVIGVSSNNLLDALSTTLIAAILSLSVVLVTGHAGQLSLATYTLAGLGALVAAHGAADYGLPFPAALVGALAVGGLGGAGIALMSLRVRGDILAIVTLAMALACESLVLANPDLTGGISGLSVPTPSLAGFSLDALAHPQRYVVTCAIMFGLCAVLVSNLRRGAAGRRLLALRSSERAASTLGISVNGMKVYAHVVAGALAGLAGGLEAFSQPQLVFTTFTVDATMAILVGTALAGIGFVAAAPMAGLAVSGGVIYYLLSLTGWQQYLPLGLGLLLLINLIFVPDGVVPENIRMFRWVARKLGVKERASPTVALAGQAGEGGEVQVARRGATLEIRDLHVAFGGVTALDTVTATLRAGHVEGLIGPNGAGKTSFIDAVTGLTRRYGGEVLVDGQPIGRASADWRARAGIGRTLQGLELFDDLTVLENLMIGSEVHDRRALVRDMVMPRPVRLSQGATLAAMRFKLGAVLDRRPSELPYGQRRLVAIARAVASEPAVLLLDEPAAGLSVQERGELVTLIRELVAEWGMAILLVEHDVDLVMRVCDHITVLEFGKVIASGLPQDVRQDPDVRRAFLGTVGQA